MNDYTHQLTQMCQSMDEFLNGCGKVSKKMKMKATSGVCIKRYRLEYSISWNIDYTIPHINRSISAFIPTHLSHLAKEEPLRKDLVDPIGNDLAHRCIDGLSLTHDVFNLCLNPASSFEIFFMENKPRLMIEYAHTVVGSRNPKVVFKQACFFDTWKENLKFAVRQAVEHEMFTPELFDKQTEMVQAFVKQSCEDLPTKNEISSYILRSRMHDEVEQSPHTSPRRKL